MITTYLASFELPLSKGELELTVKAEEGKYAEVDNDMGNIGKRLGLLYHSLIEIGTKG